MATPKLEAQAGKLHIVIEQGTTFNPVFTYKDSLGAVIDLTGYTARMQIRLKKTSTAFIHEITTAGSGITLGGVLGTITLLITDVETAAFTFTTGVYDLEIISAGGIVTRLLEGTASLSKEATK